MDGQAGIGICDFHSRLLTNTRTKTNTKLKKNQQDRELKLYEGFWHSLTAGELEENVDQVFADIFAWYVRVSAFSFVCLSWMDVRHRGAYHDPQ